MIDEPLMIRRKTLEEIVDTSDDAMNLSTSIGSLAGDDTVMIVMRDTNAAAAFCTEMKNLLD